MKLEIMITFYKNCIRREYSNLDDDDLKKVEKYMNNYKRNCYLNVLSFFAGGFICSRLVQLIQFVHVYNIAPIFTYLGSLSGAMIFWALGGQIVNQKFIDQVYPIYSKIHSPKDSE
eukprot:Mrub_14286.p1 GENE.Mrub_14286~~Mrub_14286.p1  ORF type:complete len:134 (-),score=5.17 Mrub_14286:52-399(-)